MRSRRLAIARRACRRCSPTWRATVRSLMHEVSRRSRGCDRPAATSERTSRSAPRSVASVGQSTSLAPTRFRSGIAPSRRNVDLAASSSSAAPSRIAQDAERPADQHSDSRDLVRRVQIATRGAAPGGDAPALHVRHPRDATAPDLCADVAQRNGTSAAAAAAAGRWRHRWPPRASLAASRISTAAEEVGGLEPRARSSRPGPGGSSRARHQSDPGQGATGNIPAADRGRTCSPLGRHPPLRPVRP